jgi:hypothetical protein
MKQKNEWISHQVNRREKQNKSELVGGLYFLIHLLGNMESKK